MRCPSESSSNAFFTRVAISAAGILRSFSPKATLSATVLCGHSAYDWNTSPRLRASAGTSSPAAPSKTTLSPILIVPLCGTSRPATARSNVVLPLPEGPRDRQPDADQHDVDERERGDDVDRPALPQRDELRADHFRSGREQVHARRVFALEDHEDEQPRADEPGAD